MLNHQSQSFQLTQMLGAGSKQIDPGRVDRAVPQHVCQFDDIMSNFIESDGKKMPQIVREYFGVIHMSTGTEPLHGLPYLMAGEAGSAFGEKDLAGGDFLFSGIFQQFAA